jgi:putative membrane protein
MRTMASSLSAVRNPWLHLAQHASFFLPAALFWWAVLAPTSRQLGALVALFTTMLHTGALGALMTCWLRRCAA